MLKRARRHFAEATREADVVIDDFERKPVRRQVSDDGRRHQRTLGMAGEAYRNVAAALVRISTRRRPVSASSHDWSISARQNVDRVALVKRCR